MKRVGGHRGAVTTHNSVCSINIGVLRRPFYRSRHAHDSVRDGFAGLLPVSASSLSGTGGARSQTSGGRSPSAAAPPSVASSRRPPTVGLALPNLAALLEGVGAGQTRNRDPVAPARIPQILALALMLKPRWAAWGESRDSSVDTTGERCQSAVGSATDSRRNAKTGDRSQPGNRRQTYGSAAWSALTNLAGLLEQSDRRHCRHRYVCGRHRRISLAL